MIVRINQIDPARAEQESGWPSTGLAGPLHYTWPADARAFELLILENDEQKRPLTETFLQEQLRKVIPVAVAAFSIPGEVLVARLDGPLAEGELVGVFHYLGGKAEPVRFATSEFQNLEAAPGRAVGSIRLQPTSTLLSALCTDAAVGLERSVRLRLFAVPEPLVAPLLDANLPDDERWDEILPRCGFALSTVRGLRSLQIRSSRFEPAEVKARLMRRLLAVAQAPQ